MLQAPSPAKALRLPGVEVRDRDLELIADLFHCRIITVVQASRLYYDSEGVAGRRLCKLAEAGLLGTLKRVEKSGPGRTPNVYSLAKTGFKLLVEENLLPKDYEDQWDGKWRRRFEVGQVKHKHEIGVMELKSLLMPAWNATANRRVIHFGTWPERYKFEVRSDGRRMPDVKPDGYVQVACHASPGADAEFEHFYLEFDRGSEKHDTLWRKFDAYRLHYRSGGFARQLLGDRVAKVDRALIAENPFRVLFVMNNVRRLANFLEIHQAALTDVQLLWLTTMDEIRAEPMGRIWTVPKFFFSPTAASGGEDEPRRFSLLDETAERSSTNQGEGETP